ncbi:MAG TPA: hypothetical protein VHA82_12620, partial [Ramlibacter sp.]|nr:hypothetical protein [Ramlibacter sp.]
MARQLKAPHNTALRRAFAVWIKRVVLRHLPEGEEPAQVQDLTEIPEMIGERMERWKQQLLQQG